MTDSAPIPCLPPAVPPVPAGSMNAFEGGPFAQQVADIVGYFQTLSPSSVARMGEFYAGQAHFTDPFNDVIGVPAIQAIFAHMFVTLKQPRFVVTQQVCQGHQCFLTWEFRFYFRNYKVAQEQVILGASHLVLNETGQITMHRDYWDAAQELYEKLPVVGSLMRWLRARVAN
jgi:SnoaL-like domain